MKVVYLPVYRTAVSYTVSFGRRWSVLEHLVLLELTKARRSLAELADMTGLPERLVVEALINLMRSNWIEVRSSTGVLFQATVAGKRRAEHEALPPQVQTDVRWLSLCFERLTGSWLRAEDLDLVYEDDLPNDADVLNPKINTLHSSHGGLRDLFKLSLDETLEPVEPQFRSPSRPYARVVIAFDRIERGLPTNASMALIEEILEEVGPTSEGASAMASAQSLQVDEVACRDFLTKDSFVVGGDNHRSLLSSCLRTAKSRLVLHSCFLDPLALKQLLPEFEAAAKRGIRVDLLWGLQQDPEEKLTRNVVAESRQVLAALSEEAQKRVQLSPNSSLSHSKVVLFDEGNHGRFTTIVSSCNFLQSQFVSLDVSVRSHSQRLALQFLNRLLAAQIPPSGSWPAVARRLNADWQRVHYHALNQEAGAHKLIVLSDQDHYACVRHARNIAKDSIIIGCDIYGLAAETSVLVPMQRAAELGKHVRLLYQRPSKLLRETGRVPEVTELAKRGLMLEQYDGLHGKFLLWDEDSLAVSSFNWLSTVADGTRVSGAELGVFISGPSLRQCFAEQMLAASAGRIDLARKGESQGTLDLKMTGKV